MAAAAEPRPAPEVALKELDGKPFSLEALRGKVVILDFWASWCLPCRKSFPFFDRLSATYRSEGLEVVGLTLEEDSDAILAFVEAVPAHFSIVRDPSGRAGEAFGVVSMPTTFLLDREGRIVARFEGGGEKAHERLEAALLTVLSSGTVAAGSDVRVSSEPEPTGEIRAWRRGYLADPIMNLDGDPLTRIIKEHIFASKEGAAGDGGTAGGGCGCN